MCDSLREDDERYAKAKELMEQDGCKQQNDKLSQCLKEFKKDWRKCIVLNLDQEYN